MTKKQLKKLETLLAKTEALENDVHSYFARERLRDAKDHLFRLWKDPHYEYRKLAD